MLHRVTIERRQVRTGSSKCGDGVDGGVIDEAVRVESHRGHLGIAEPTLHHSARDSSFGVRAATTDTQLIFLHVAVWCKLVLVVRRFEADADATTFEQDGALNVQSVGINQPPMELNSFTYERVPSHLPVESAPPAPVRAISCFAGVVRVHGFIVVTAVAVVGVDSFGRNGVCRGVVANGVIEHGSVRVNTGRIGDRQGRRVSWTTVTLRFLRGHSRAINGNTTSNGSSGAVVGECHEGSVVFTVGAIIDPGMLSSRFGSESLFLNRETNRLATNDLW
jgi:hypothetical protein